jgi:hypothetical protein
MPHLPGIIDETTLSAASPRELLATHERLLGELRRRNVVRTNDAPSGQYAEWLAQQILGGELAPNSVKSFDLITATGERIQVKARVIRAAAEAPLRTERLSNQGLLSRPIGSSVRGR